MKICNPDPNRFRGNIIELSDIGMENGDGWVVFSIIFLGSDTGNPFHVLFGLKFLEKMIRLEIETDFLDNFIRLFWDFECLIEEIIYNYFIEDNFQLYHVVYRK